MFTSSSSTVQWLECLVFLRIAISASRVALVWKSLGFLFSFLEDQIVDSTWAVNHTRGCKMSSGRGPRSSRTSWEGRRLGRWECSTLSIQSDTSELLGHKMRAWLGVSGWSSEHEVQLGLLAFLIPILWSLSCVGIWCCGAFSTEKFCSQKKVQGDLQDPKHSSSQLVDLLAKPYRV